MRILAITHLFPNEGNCNDGIFAARQLAEMKKQGADITVLVPMVWCPRFLRWFRRWRIYNHKWKCFYRDIEGLGISYLRFPGRWFYPLASRSVFYAIKNTVVKLHKEKPIDIIYARFFAPDGYAALELSNMLGVPAVAVGAGDDVNVDPHFNRFIYRDFVRVANGLDGVLASGGKAAASIKAVSGRKVLAVHGVVDTSEFAPVQDKGLVRKELNFEPDKFVALYVGSYKVVKGVFELIDVVGRIVEQVPHFRLKVCGYGRQEESMRAAIEQKGLTKVIDMVGLVDPTQMPKWMQAADMLVLPSYEEGMPNAVMEAMACGLPVVASAVGGLPQETGDCEGTILIEPKSTDELFEAMMRVIQDDQLRIRMQEASRQRAEERFSVQRNARIVLDYLKKVAKQPMFQ